MYNIYCDESCHLENDGFDIMVLGSMTCPQHSKSKIFKDIRDIKTKHGLSTWFEIKWTKVSQSKIDFYIDIIDYFFKNDDLTFRTLIAKDKKNLDHNKFNEGDYDTWYYKMYFVLLAPLIEPYEEYNIYIDIKDTKGGPRVKKLRQVLCNNIYDFKSEVIENLSQINSVESEILQLADLFIGAYSYYHRGEYLKNKANKGKCEILKILSNKYDIDFSKKTSRNARKVNSFIWNPKGAIR